VIDLGQRRWFELWQRLNALGDSDSVFASLASAYSTPPRAYHNLDHIAQCLDEFEPARSLALNPNDVELAIWFHDAVYDPRKIDNEERSAGLAVSMIRSARLPDALASRVASLILATKHNAPPADLDSGLIVDVDLSILGQPAPRFDEYEHQIRQEYDWVANDAFAAGRTKVLKSFLERATIYATELFRNKYETAARDNLARSLARLSAGA
jgi:predicted metal-dependent HD superfamily phosphohydrolase